MLGIVLVGSPGAGKGTLGEHLSEVHGFNHFSSGDLLRNEVKNQTSIGRQISEILKQGGQVDDALITKMCLGKIKEILTKNQPFSMDGFPQTDNQKESLDKFALKHPELNLKYICVLVDKDTALERMSNRLSCSKCNAIFNKHLLESKEMNMCDKCDSPLVARDSDRPERAEKRLQTFSQTTDGVIQELLNDNDTYVIDGNKSMEDVKDQFNKFMHSRQETNYEQLTQLLLQHY